MPQKHQVTIPIPIAIGIGTQNNVYQPYTFSEILCFSPESFRGSGEKAAFSSGLKDVGQASNIKHQISPFFIRLKIIKRL